MKRSQYFWLGVSVAGLAALAVLLLYRDRQRRKESAAFGGEPGRLPPERRGRGITLKPGIAQPQEGRAAPLKLSAFPHPLRRNQPGTVRVETLPGATCIIKARYSTGFAPTSLDADPRASDESGVCEWRWEIGTSGAYVDIEVQVWQEHHIVNSARQRIEVVD